MTFAIAVEEHSHVVAAEIGDRLSAFNRASAENSRSMPLQVTLRDGDGALVGGILASTRFDMLRIDDVFVDARARSGGWGTKLMAACEAEAMRRGARLCCVLTFSWQARPFYEKLGYAVFAELPYNDGEHHIYWLKKHLCA